MATIKVRKEDGSFVEIPSGSTPQKGVDYWTEQDKQEMRAELVNLIYPVGSLYMSVNNVNPGNFLGGVWTSWGQGRTLVGVGPMTDEEGAAKSWDQSEIQGGRLKTHLISHTHEMDHTHSDTFAVASGGAHTHTMNHGHSDTFAVASGGAHRHKMYGIASRVAGNNWDACVASDNGAQSGDQDWTAMTSAGSHSHTLNGAVTNYSGSSGSAGSHSHTLNGAVSEFAGSTTSSGEAQLSDGNLPPYITCYFWKRVS